MKKISILKYFALFLAIGIMSCGSDDQLAGTPGGGTPVVSSVSISANTNAAQGVTTLFEGESTTFVVTDNLGNDVTSDSVITINGDVVTDNPYVFTTAGTYVVVVTNGDFTSTITIIVEEVPVPTAITLTTNLTSCWVDESVTITVMDDLGNNVTSIADITVGGVDIIVNPHVLTAAGSFDIVATFSGLTSNTVAVTTVASTHTTKVLVEDYTGAWCGYCPRLAYNIDELATNNSSVIPVAIHVGNTDPGAGSHDPYDFVERSTLTSTFGIDGYPTGKINRTTTWNESDAQVLNALNDNRSCGLAIDSSISGTTLSVDAKVHYDIDADGAHRLVVYVLEDNLHYNQANYMNNDNSSHWYGAGNPIVGFEHDNVGRAVLTNVLGDAIASSEAVMGNTYTQSFNYTIPAAYVAANLELVAFVVDADDKVVNVQMVQAGSNQAFD